MVIFVLIMKYCSHCGSNQLTLTVPKGDERTRQVCGACDTIHYQNPRLIVGTLSVFEDKILALFRSYWINELSKMVSPSALN